MITKETHPLGFRRYQLRVGGWHASLVFVGPVKDESSKVWRMESRRVLAE